MAYAVIADVTELLAQFTLDANSSPSTDQATNILSDISDEIDTALASKGISVPVTAPTYYKDALGRLNAYGAAAAVLKSMFPDATGAGETPAYAFWEGRYKRGLEGIKNGTLIPPDLTKGSGEVAPSTYLTVNPDAEVEDGDIAGSFFTRAKVF